jgi:hypothetical protein
MLIHNIAHWLARPSRRRTSTNVGSSASFNVSNPIKIENRYVTDIDSFCALALAATASRKQAAQLRDFMYKYLACRALIGVEIPVSLFRKLRLTLKITNHRI